MIYPGTIKAIVRPYIQISARSICLCVCVCIHTHLRYMHVNIDGNITINTHTYTNRNTHSQATHHVQRIMDKETKNLAPVRYTPTTLTLTSKVEVSDGGVSLERRRQCLGSLVADAIVWRESEERGETSVLTDEFFRASPSSTPTIHRTHTHTHILRLIKPRGVYA